LLSDLQPENSVSLKKTRFTEMLIEANGLDRRNFQCWAFCPGMLFNSTDKWWGDHGKRDFPHEGIDFCMYKDLSGQLLRIDQKTRIPVMYDGFVRAVFRDYLGQALIIEHENARSGGRSYLSVYAHTKPCDGVNPGTEVKEGDIIATIADTSRSKAKILPHLHLSLGRPLPDLVYEPFVWNMMRDRELVDLQDPMSAIDWPCQVMDPQHRFCQEL
jgi:murein DD-endopeptidase MepM/ murein hydrolase activator NlpD